SAHPPCSRPHSTNCSPPPTGPSGLRAAGASVKARNRVPCLRESTAMCSRRWPCTAPPCAPAPFLSPAANRRERAASAPLTTAARAPPRRPSIPFAATIAPVGKPSWSLLRLRARCGLVAEGRAHHHRANKRLRAIIVPLYLGYDRIHRARIL